MAGRVEVSEEVDALVALLRPGRLKALVAMERQPLTARGLEAELGIDYPAARFAIKKMLRDGLIVQAGTERNRQNKEVPTYRPRHKGWYKLVPLVNQIIESASHE